MHRNFPKTGTGPQATPPLRRQPVRIELPRPDTQEEGVRDAAAVARPGEVAGQDATGGASSQEGATRVEFGGSGITGTTMGEIVREARERRRLTLRRAAELAAISPAYLSTIENGARTSPPSAQVLGRLESVLGLEPGHLVKLASWQTTPAPVKREMARLAGEQQVTRDFLTRLREVGTDAMHKSGELSRLIARMEGGDGDRDSATGIRHSPEGTGDSPFGERGYSDLAMRLGVALPLEIPLINSVAAGYPTEFTDLGYPARVADQYVRSPDVCDPDAFAARVVGESMLPEYREGDIVVFSPAKIVKSGMDCFVRLEPLHETTFKRVYIEGERGSEVIRLQPLNSKFPPRVVPREEVAGLYAAVSVTRAV
jgi:repressor LexA